MPAPMVAPLSAIRLSNCRGPNVSGAFRSGQGRGPFVSPLPFGEIFYTVGDSGVIFSSPDLVNWSPLSSGTTNTLYSCSKILGSAIASANNFVYRIAGGIVSQIPVSGLHLDSIVDNLGRYIILNNASSFSFSADGAAWTTVSVSTFATLCAAASSAFCFIGANSGSYCTTVNLAQQGIGGGGIIGGAAIWAAGWNNGRWLAAMNSNPTQLVYRATSDPTPGFPGMSWALGTGTGTDTKDALNSKTIIGDGANTVLCSFSAQGKIYRSVNNGNSWAAVNLPVNGYPNGIIYRSGNFYVIVRIPGTGSVLLKSVDGFSYTIHASFPGAFLNAIC